MKTKIIWALVMVALFGAMVTTASATDYNVYSGNSVQAAITNATAGDTIYVHNYTGTYAKFDVTKQLFMIGVDMPTVDGDSGFTIKINAGGCTVEGFKAITASGGYNQAEIVVQSSGNLIKDNYIDSNSNNAMLIHRGYNANSNTVINNTFKSNSRGIKIYTNSNTIAENDFVAGYTSLYIGDPSTGGNLFYHNNFRYSITNNCVNTWYNSTISEGNYYSANSGCTDNDSNGICDNPYQVGADWDQYPLVNTWPPTGDTTPPASITNLANSTGNFWINWTWSNPSDSDFNHTMIYIDNGWVLNRSESFYNYSYSAHATKTISTHTVDETGNVNNTWVNQTTTIPNNQITITNTSGASVTEGEMVYVDYDATDADSDTPVFSCNRTDLFTDFNTGTGKGNWTTTDTDVGVHYVDFGVSDGYGSTDNYTMTITVNSAEQTPPNPTNIANMTGNFWVNHTWSAGSGNVTDSYNVSVNETWHNDTTNTFWNNTDIPPHGWSNITVYAWNSSGTGTLSTGSASQDTQIPNNLPVLDPIGNKAVNETETLAIDADATDPDSDMPTYSCNRTDLFTDFDPATGAGNWTPGYGDSGIYYVDFGAADGYGGIDNETVRITVNETAVTGNILYFRPDTSTVPGYCCSVDVDVMALVNESNPIIATDVNITFDPGCINITNWVNNSGVWNGSTCPLGSVPQGYVHITTTVGENPAVNGTVRIGTLTIHCNNTTCCGTALNFTSQSMFIKEGSGFIYPERDNGSFLCGWYWKDYNGEAEGGYMPDFDQNQNFTDTPEIEENYCAPTAMANSLWWFDQKYPDRDVVYPGATPQELVQELAWLMDTNGQRTGSPHNGTYVADEQAGIEEYLIQHGLTDLLYEHTELKPEFGWIEEEIERCQDVKLDLGFYQVLNVIELEPGQWQIEWKRIGGHAVTAAGVNSNCSRIAVSDPDADNAEFGLSGVVRGPNHNHGGVPFRDPAYDHTQHNDCVSASHDIYNVAPSISPGGTWELTDPYWRNETVAYRYAYNNGGQWMNTTNYNGSSPPIMVGDIRTEIEAAVVVSPKNCTPGIEVNKTVWDPVTKDWVEEITSQANISGCVRYRIRIQNNGTCCDLTNLVVNDTLPGFLTYNNSAIPFEPIDLGGNKYQWTFPTLNKSETKTIEFNATVNNTGNGANEASATAWCVEFGVECSDGDGAYITAVGCGDVNGDGFANIHDGIMVAAGNAGVNEWAADANCDGFANIDDGIQIASGTTNCCPDCL